MGPADHNMSVYFTRKDVNGVGNQVRKRNAML